MDYLNSMFESSRSEISFNLSGGRAKSFMPYKNKYSSDWPDQLVKLFTHFFMRFAFSLHNLYFLVVLIINSIPQVQKSYVLFSNLPYLLLFITNLVIEFSIHIYFKLKRYSAHSSNKDLKYLKVIPAVTDPDILFHSEKKEKKAVSKQVPLMTLVNRRDIFIGDIMRLEYGDVSPCDILVLASSCTDSGAKQTFQADSMLDNGAAVREKKECIGLTKSFSQWAGDPKDPSKFLKRLSGKVSYKLETRLDEIHGTFKLKSDPKTEAFDNSKILKKGAHLKSDYIVGLVIFNGESCFPMDLNTFFEPPKVTALEKKLRFLTLLLIALNLVLAVFLTLVHRRLRTFENRDGLRDKVGVLSHISLLLSVLPMGLSIFRSLFSVFASMKLQKIYGGFSIDPLYEKTLESGQFSSNFYDSLMFQSTHKAKPKEKRGVLSSGLADFAVFNPDIITNMGDVDDIFFDKTNTLATGNHTIQSISTRKKLYFTNKKNFDPEHVEIRGSVHHDDWQKEQQSPDSPTSIMKPKLSAPSNPFSLQKKSFGESKGNLLLGNSMPESNLAVSLPPSNNKSLDEIPAEPHIVNNIKHSSYITKKEGGNLKVVNFNSNHQALEMSELNIQKFSSNKEPRTPYTPKTPRDLETKVAKREVHLALHSCLKNKAHASLNALHSAPLHHQESYQGSKTLIHDQNIHFFDGFNFYDDLNNPNENYFLRDIMKMFALCHSSSIMGEKYRSESVEEHSQILLAKNYGMEFIGSSEDDSKNLSSHRDLKSYQILENGVNLHNIEFFFCMKYSSNLV